MALRQQPTVLANVAGHFHAVHLRHGNIDDYHIGLRHDCLVERFHAPSRFGR